MKTKITFILLVMAGMVSQWALAGGDVPTKFSNRDSIRETRHNMTQRPTQAGPGGILNGALMDLGRNDYGEVCVYCHTPHGANANISVPLWNRTVKATTYQLYNQANLNGPVSAPGANSLSCLSCHDGQTAIDSVVNMPGSGRANPNQMASQDNAFLSTWPGSLGAHHALNNTGCLVCHAPGPTFPLAGDFTVFVIGTDLTNDHPVGVKLPAIPSDFFPTNGFNAKTGATFFDDSPVGSPGRMDKDEIRFYDTGDGPKVECASCHDPHGVPSAGPGSTFNPTFLRKANTGSAVCLTCHNK